jgi:hypothetical protein
LAHLRQHHTAHFQQSASVVLLRYDFEYLQLGLLWPCKVQVNVKQAIQGHFSLSLTEKSVFIGQSEEILWKF